MALTLVQGDITDQRVDAIVNAANNSLLGGGGVDGAIHRRGGPDILRQTRTLRASTLPAGLPTGDAVATGAGDLPARWVIHTVGPIYGQGTADQLRSCYRRSLQVARDLGAVSVAFPLISAGVYGWPFDDAVRTAVEQIEEHGDDLEVRLVLFAPDQLDRARRLVGAGP